MKKIFSKEELSKIFKRDIGYDGYGVSINSKEVKKGDIFIALPGERVDGHLFIEEAITNGANIIISEKDMKCSNKKKLIVCKSSYEALVMMASYNLMRVDAKYIGVTGSIGKTTTKDMIYHILNTEISQKVYVSKKNFNSKIGLPMCVATMPQETKIGIFEMGMSGHDDIRYLTKIVRPNISVITNIHPVHLEFFDSEFSIAKAKSEILEEGPEYAIIPSDSPYMEFFKKKSKNFGVKNFVSFGSQNNSDVRIKQYDYLNDSINICAEFFGKSIFYKIRTKNDALVANSVAAIIAAHFSTGIDVQTFAHNIESFSVASNRGGLKVIKNRLITLIDDSYNSSPRSVLAAIRVLSKLSGKRKIAVLGDMKELGVDGVYFHENLSPLIDKYEIDLVFACGELSKYMYDNLRICKKGMWKANSEMLAEHIVNEILEGDCIMIKGSRSMKMENIVDKICDSY